MKAITLPEEFNTAKIRSTSFAESPSFSGVEASSPHNAKLKNPSWNVDKPTHSEITPSLLRSEKAAIVLPSSPVVLLKLSPKVIFAPVLTGDIKYSASIPKSAVALEQEPSSQPAIKS